MLVRTKTRSTAQKRRTPKPDDPEQSKRFVETARQIKADETGEAFERAYLLTLLIGAAIAAPAISTANSPGSRRAM